MSDHFDVILAPYASAAAAQQDFDALVALVKDKTVRSEGVILVDHDAAGQVRVTQTGDHLGRKGLGWGGGVGLVVGLFSPPLLASVVVGGAAGALVGRFARHKLDSGLEEGLGDKLAPGTALVIAMVDEDDRLAAERALQGTPAKSVVRMEKGSLRELKSALAEAAGKFTPDRTVLPIPDRNFGGTAGRTLRESVADWSMIPGPQAPEDAPNVLVVLIDDAGFGNTDTFGGPISTPTLTRVQRMGLTYNRFHVTAVCSPTRAALLTGRNQHRVGFGSIAEYPGPFPGYSAVKPRTCAAVPRILRDNGYVTGGFGKWHLTPDNVQGAAGPFDHWPQAWGFDHWWGFLSGAAGQYDPIITQDNSTIGVLPGTDGKPYYFPDDLTDEAIEWLHAVRAQDATKPWMMYYSTGCAHAPHHVAREWADRYKGRFDRGWDVLREETLARQKELGIVPPDTELTPRPDLFPAWDSLSENQKKLYARQMEVYAGFCENADWNVGRLLDAVEAMGDLENTLVVYIWGDNGASMEGTVTGSFNEMTFLNGIVLDADHQLQLIEEYGGIEALGGDHTAPHYAAAWAHAGNTPFRWGKQMASHLGGTRNPMVVAWPARIEPSAEIRAQFTHCIDLAPTILEAVGLPEPTMVDGIAQEPMDGTSFLYTFGDAGAEERHTTQYFEMFASRAMYKDGWWAASKPDRVPWDFSPGAIRRFGPEGDFDPDRDAPWELYFLPDDFSQARDVAAEHPDKVRELQELWWAEAERNRVLPLFGGASVMFGILPPMPTMSRYAFAGDVQNVQRGMVPRIFGRSYAIEADLQVPEGGAEGVIVANADFIGGFALWVDPEGRLRHTYSMLGVETYRQRSSEPLPTGDVSVKVLFVADESKPGTGGVVTLYANDKVVGEGKMPRTVPVAFSSYSGMDVGRDNGLVVDREYEPKAPYAFTGTVTQVVFDLKPATHEDEKALHEHAAMQAVGRGAAG
ncbi:MAG TPA: sulfatase-like hydrolase/transferase [Acidimicrobiales bacterium]|nr:sulfatase-like hydrolase/transferase [Acidimicrobiales bacterium]